MNVSSLEFVDPENYQSMVSSFKQGTNIAALGRRDILSQQQLSKGNTTEVIRVEISKPMWEVRSLVLKGLGFDWPQQSPGIKSISAWNYLKSKELPTWENAGLVTIDRRGLYFATPDLVGEFDKVISLPAHDLPDLAKIKDNINWEELEASCQHIIRQIREKLSDSSEVSIEYNTWMFGLKLKDGLYSITSWVGDIDKIYPKEKISNAAETEKDFRKAITDLLEALGASRDLNL